MSQEDARQAALYDRYFSRVYAYVRARVASPQDAEDLTAETFLRALGALSRFAPRHDGAEAAWLFRIAHNQISNHRRKGGQAITFALEDMPIEPHSDEQPDEAAARAELAARLRLLVASLAPRHQEVIALRFFAGLRNQEIAAVLGLEQRTVAAHISRALAELQRRLGGPDAAGSWAVADDVEMDMAAYLRRLHTGLPQPGDPLPAPEEGPIAIALPLAAPRPDDELRERLRRRLAASPAGRMAWLRRLLRIR